MKLGDASSLPISAGVKPTHSQRSRRRSTFYKSRNEIQVHVPILKYLGNSTSIAIIVVVRQMTKSVDASAKDYTKVNCKMSRSPKEHHYYLSCVKLWPISFSRYI